jgi:predicted  nucleic acid-binding Zn-ribbon protein
MTALVITLAAGCASTPPEPTLADAMRGHSAEAQQEAELKRDLAKRWERGNKLETTGKNRVERAREQINEAEQKIVEARDAIERGTGEIAEGRELKAESERRFRARFPDASLEPYDRDLDR